MINGKVLKTTDGGENWTNINPNDVNGIAVYDVFFVNENTGYAITTDSIYRSTDGG